jgi:hypothetical protein
LGIDPHGGLVDTDFLFTSRDDWCIAERSAQKTKCLTQRAAGVRLVELRPEDGNDRIAPVKAIRASEREVGE